MKKCPKCGQICQDSDAFCDACGCELTGMTGQRRMVQQTQGNKSSLPIILGCVAAALVLVVVTVVCVKILNSEKEESVDVSGVMNQSEQTNKSSRLSQKSMQEEKSILEAAEEVQEEMEDVEETTGEEQVQDSQKDSQVSQEKYETMYVVNCHESITLRKTPSTSAGEICQIPFGSSVSYVETADNGFYKIIYNGKTGYGLASYLSTEKQDTPAASSWESQDSVTYMQVVNCRESITLRKVPSTKAEQFCQIPLGAVVEYLGTAENGFYMVSYNGYIGYALASYLTEW